MGCAFTLEIPMQRKCYPHNSSQMDVSCGLGALSRRASIDQEEALALRRSESWRYMLRQLGTCSPFVFFITYCTFLSNGLLSSMPIPLLLYEKIDRLQEFFGILLA